MTPEQLAKLNGVTVSQEDFTIREAGDGVSAITDKQTTITVGNDSVTLVPMTEEELIALLTAEPIKAFSECTWAEIKDYTDRYYAGELNPTVVDDVSITWEDGTVWEIGDTQVMHVGNIASTNTKTFSQSSGVDNSVDAKDYNIRIIGINHDDLTTANNGKTKAFITLDMASCLWNGDENQYMENYFSTDATLGLQPMDNAFDSGSTSGDWEASDLRAWLQNNFYNALDADLKSCIKSVNKQSKVAIDEKISDTVFLLSEVEVSGLNTSWGYDEGTKYPYYSDNTSRCKMPKWNDASVSGFWWLRSVYSGSSFYTVGNTGSVYGDGNASNAYGVSAAFCI